MKKLILILISLGLLSILAVKLPPLNNMLDGPEFCGSCHFMEPWVETWYHSAHREVASCGDCHIPHDLVRGAFYKAYTGSRDALETITGQIPRSFLISGHGSEVVHENCLSCHSDLLRIVGDTKDEEGVYCFRCHRNTPHPPPLGMD
ncbi:MAG: cytochrome C nitrite reductase [Clostridiaceae bacterium BRH_c20a]|nr:MAG: cytochrome C nitrite reductase [Clostridiaceae bacterium BRH_c20a]